jgi:hypothetical protein
MTEGGARTTRAMVRRFTVGSGPLKRRSDRLQFGARLLLVTLLLALAVPVGLAVGTAVYTQGRADAALQAATRHRTAAQLLEDASDPAQSADDVWHPARAHVTWTGPSGGTHEAVIDVPAGARADSTVHVWVDDSGRLTAPPVAAGDAAREGVSLGIFGFLAFTVVTVLSYEAFRCVLDMSRSRSWEDEWAAVEPVWTGKVTEE